MEILIIVRHLIGFGIFLWMTVVSCLETTEISLAGVFNGMAGYEPPRLKSSFSALFCFKVTLIIYNWLFSGT